ncbi:translation elongation factor Ts [Candidatus Uhrbacteria bacterium RIFCSPLOWO2_01_FULL_53_9]|uniref:Elongation factor Ts n=3 Tax=Candidatus Uhriibacteriota TaxID=1752732 RepID=A0A1F7UXD5_9BACT|nr:MAG: translation elongation factor Ts [Candidatus Uhrbacteria bacterium RIFCSPHIGHO2_02_FULL_53_13]OGL82916.1 MAG: translation elongation factor Ts [Candidatus Uhrbacteria bacterium RIFCSPLOWO2_01_FULL_53_9]OGL89214.1 MAG: translation elongation factor Ts [Candidatus Uhrbacteria bacterium RIFCSPLOWO2_02_FULL_53_10]
MTISAKDVAQLREETGAGMMNAKNALEEAGGDMSKAKEILRAKGQAKAAKRAGRSTSEGLVYSYIHATGKLGVLLELQCETDFVARNEQFKELGRQIAMHVAASDPRFVDVASVSADALENTRREYEEEASASGKPADVVAKIVEGKMEKWMGEVVLMKQPFVMDEDKTIETLLNEAIATMSENIRVTRFARFNIEGDMSVCEAAAVPVGIDE